MRDPMFDLAPWPKTAEEATADAICKSLTVVGAWNLRALTNHPSPMDAVDFARVER